MSKKKSHDVIPPVSVGKKTSIVFDPPCDVPAVPEHHWQILENDTRVLDPWASRVTNAHHQQDEDDIFFRTDGREILNLAVSHLA